MDLNRALEISGKVIKEHEQTIAQYKNALEEIATAQNLTATPEQWAQYLQSIAAEALK